MDKQPFYPGQVLGVMGGGYAAKRLVMTAKLMGFTVGAYGASVDDDALQLADFMVIGQPNEKEPLQQFAETCDFVTYVSGKVQANVIQFMAQFTQIPQGQEVLDVIQDRLVERAFFDEINVNNAPYETIVELDDVYQAIDSIGYPAVLKPIQRRPGDDTMMIERSSDVAKADDFIDSGTFILESYIPHIHEFSLIVSAGKANQAFPIVEIEHKDGHLEEVSLANVDGSTAAEMQRIGTAVVEHLHGLGNFEIGFYQTDTDALYVKGVTPGLVQQADLFEGTSNVDQYEAHLRAIAGMQTRTLNEPHQAIMMTLQADKLAEVKTQWVLKDNWIFRLYSKAINGEVGYVIATGEFKDNIQLQLDNTEIWKKVNLY